MRTPPRILRFLALFVLLLGAPGIRAQPAAADSSIAERQQNLNTQIEGLADSYRNLRQELRTLNAAPDDIAVLDSALQTLNRLHETDVPRIVSLLRQGNASAALGAQKQVSLALRDLSILLQQRQQELAVARRARDLVLRQAANRRRIDALRLGAALDGARTYAIAEQDALQTEIQSLADQVNRLRQDPERKTFELLDRAAPPDLLASLRDEAARAAERTRAADYTISLAAQLLLQDGLQRISTLGRSATSLSSAAQAALKELDALIADQTQLRTRSVEPNIDTGRLGWDQDKLTARADALRSDVNALSAHAGSSLREAADAMHASRLKFARSGKSDFLSDQDKALQQLGQVRALLSALVPDESKAAKTDPASSELRELAQRAQSLANQQEQLNQRVAATPQENTSALATLAREQAELARQTSQLQTEAQLAESEAAGELGQAASLMAESAGQSDTNPAAADAAAQAAADHLKAASQQLLAEAGGLARQEAQTQIAEAGDALQNATEQLAQAAQQVGTPQASDAAQEAANQLQQAQNNLAQAAQNASQNTESRKALSEAWNSIKDAMQKTEQGQLTAAKQAAQNASEALKKATQTQEQTTGDEGGMDNGYVENHGDDAAEKIGVAGLTQADREAISAARRQPVPAAYSGMVEAYYDALNETTP